MRYIVVHITYNFEPFFPIGYDTCYHNPIAGHTAAKNGKMPNQRMCKIISLMILSWSVYNINEGENEMVKALVCLELSGEFNVVIERVNIAIRENFLATTWMFVW